METRPSVLNRPTIALCMIVKNEAHNLPRLFKSIEGCFDEVHITDTGSTDDTVKIAEAYGAKVHHFTWVDDFAKARNFSFSHATTDFVMWLDGDDELSSKDAFIQWRDHVMILADFWLANYWYAFDDKGNPTCIFTRERVIRKDKAFKWRYFIHEGMIPDGGIESVKAKHLSNWHVNHVRTHDDYLKDRGRNLKMLEEMYKEGALAPRMMFYFGKELHDVGEFDKSIKIFDELARDLMRLEHHDRILTYEYWVRSLLSKHGLQEANKEPVDNMLFEKALALANQGSILMPSRAELHIMVGDMLAKKGQLKEALVSYAAASVCIRPGPLDPSPIFFHADAYENLPWDMMSRVYANLGDWVKAEQLAATSYDKFGREVTKELLDHIRKCQPQKVEFNGPKVKNNDIVITCFNFACPYEWNDLIYKEKGIGGSETAAVEIAEWLAKKLNRPVLVFNRQTAERISPNGVRYIPNEYMQNYFSQFEPATHIAWRHNIKVTDAPTYLWCHDLMTPHAEHHNNYDKFICLSDFHRQYTKIIQNVPDEKIVVSKNGLNVDRFKDVGTIKKKENKIVFPSSPDRGLKRAIDIVRKAREKRPELNLELHVYYGIDNLHKYGMGHLADELTKIFEENQWIIYHGNVKQDVLAMEMMEAACWLYPADFIETFCITAIEALSAHCYPLVRNIGALKDTLKWAHETGNAKLILMDAHTDEEKDVWADHLVEIFDKKLWEKMDVSSQDYRWEAVADHFISFMGLDRKPQIPTSVVTEAEDAILPQVVEQVREYGTATV